MKKRTAKTGRKNPAKGSPGAPGSQKPVDLGSIREQIANLVGSQAVNLVETTIEKAGEGQYQAMKYLFEMIGLYPETSREEAREEDSLAKVLLRRLGLPEEADLTGEAVEEHASQAMAVRDDAVE